MDDALKDFREALTGMNKGDDETASATAAIVEQYTDWLFNIAVPVFKTLNAVIEEEDPSIEVVLIEPYGDPPKAGLEIYNPTKFVYRLALHDRTGTERAFVMKERFVPNPEYLSPQRTPGVRTDIMKAAPFFNEGQDGRFNNASEITAQDIIQDFQAEYSIYRGRQR